MPLRKEVFANSNYYHIYNRSVARQDIFKNDSDFQHFFDLLDYYRFVDNPLRFSYFSRLTPKNKIEYLSSLYDSKSRVCILAFAIMSNHFHLLVKQTDENGISKFLGILQNSYARYLNIKTDRIGAAFQSSFKVIPMESEEQILHTIRYIHLNPLTAYTLKNIDQLSVYPWTSYIDYLSLKPRRLIETDLVKSYLKSITSFVKFHKEQVDYQRELKSHTSGV